MTNILLSKSASKSGDSEGGFSLIDVVVTVAIIVALSVGGFIAYTGLVDNSKQAALDAAADQGYTMALVAMNDGLGPGDIEDMVEAAYNSSAPADGIRIEVDLDDPSTPLVNELRVTANKDGKVAIKGYELPQQASD